MLASSLHRPDDPLWRNESGYSERVAIALSKCYGYLKKSQVAPDAYLKAYTYASICVDQPMSPRQRMQISYVLGVSCVGGDLLEYGITWLEEALSLAEKLYDLGAMCELAYLLGSVHSTLFYYDDAVSHYEYSLKIVQTMNHDQNPVDPALELEIVIALAASEYVLEHFEAAEQWLSAARLLVIQATNVELQAAQIEWIAALLYRWRGSPEVALRRAMAAAKTYANKAESPTALLAYGRLQTVVADIALDLAESFADGAPNREQSAFVKLARPYVQQAVSLAQSTHDEPGKGIAQLARSRYERIAGRDTNRIVTIQLVIRQADKLQDISLLAQSYTAMGNELASRGETSEAHNFYRMTLDVIAGREIPAMGTSARHALHRARELIIVNSSGGYQ